MSKTTSMRAAVVVMVCVMLGLLASGRFELPRGEAQVTRQENPANFEYKVVPFVHTGDYRRDPTGEADAARFQEQVESLAKDGWEYVGLVCSPSSVARNYVTFKRSRR